MKKSEFARLCGVSGAMISKYARLGLIAEKDGGVDAGESLRRLEGRLNEEKRVAAIVALADGKPSTRGMVFVSKEPPPPTSTPARADDAVVSLAEFAAARQSDKARRERIEADRAEIELAQLTGKLVDAGAVAREVENAVSLFWGEVTRRERDEADTIAGALGLDALRARQLREELRKRNICLRNDYAARMWRLADDYRAAKERAAGGQGDAPAGA